MIKYYNDLGYKCKNKDIITVKIEDLPICSNQRISFKCDYCGKIVEKQYNSYTKGRQAFPKDCCHACSTIKLKDIMMSKYNVDNCSKIPEIRAKSAQTFREHYIEDEENHKTLIEKRQQTCISKYGAKSPMELDSVKNKMAATCRERYGCDNAFQNKEIQDRAKKTWFEKYGVDNPAKSSTVQEKTKQTFLERYGATSNFSRKDINLSMRYKGRKTLAEQGNVPCSKNQQYISDLFEGKANVFFNGYYLDIFFDDKNIYCEYDGGGHYLRVKLGQITKQEHHNIELKRYYILKRQGLKLFRIINTSVKLPADEILLNIKDLAFQYLESYGNWIRFDVDNQLIEIKNKQIAWDISKIIDFSALKLQLI